MLCKRFMMQYVVDKLRRFPDALVLQQGLATFRTCPCMTTALCCRERCTRAVDMFAIGCIAFYLMTGGQHVFGERMMRDANIVSGKTDTSKISSDAEAEDFVSLLVHRDPKSVGICFVSVVGSNVVVCQISMLLSICFLNLVCCRHHCCCHCSVCIQYPLSFLLRMVVIILAVDSPVYRCCLRFPTYLMVFLPYGVSSSSSPSLLFSVFL